MNKVNECVAALDEERIARMDAESKILKQIATDVFRVQEKVRRAATQTPTSLLLAKLPTGGIASSACA